MNPYQEVLQDLLRNLTQFHGAGLEPLSRQVKSGTAQERQVALDKMIQYVGHLGQFVRNYQQKLMQAHQKAKVASAEEDLIRLADYLDQNGLYALADKVDEVLGISSDIGMTAEAPAHEVLACLSDGLDQNGFYALADKVDEVLAIVKTAEDYGFVPRTRGEQEASAQERPIKDRNVGALSTRYCPDHRGVQAIRVGESVYQCPLDGKMYDYQSGYVDYEGQRVLGGSVASQTPQTSNYGGIPMRVYDSRSDVLNRMN
jgi:hypothetical protein